MISEAADDRLPSERWPAGAGERPLPIVEKAGLESALADANVPTLLMVYVHLTHDEAYLDQFTPHIRSPYSTEPATTPPELEADLRARLFALLSDPATVTAGPPSRRLMQAMMAVNVGEPVADEFLPMMMEQMGFELPMPRRSLPDRPMPSPDFKVLVIGAGLTGMVAAIKLEEAGYDYVLAEKNQDIGGTWYENRYPGVGVDTPSHFYSYSFAINPEWSHYHPKGDEMQRYLLWIADRYRLRERTAFDTRVIGCEWDETVAAWNVTVETSGESSRVIVANAVINAHGPLNRPSLPNIPGLSDFAGVAMHTALWDPSVDVAGRNVVMIGTGASGHQFAPAVAPAAAHLTVCQRSRHWVMRNTEMAKQVTEGVKFALRHIPHYKEWFRFRVFWFSGDGLFINIVRDPEWLDQELSVSAHNAAIRQYVLGHLKTSLAERPDLFEKLLPDHPVFSKRILQDEGWLDALKRDNVTLETGSIDHIEADAVVMADGTRHPADIIAMATGFQVANMLGPLRVIGRDGRDLGAEWGEDDPRAYMGLVMPGFPNFFFTVGPNSAPGHAAGQNTVSESQINYIIECLDVLQADGKRSIEPRQEPFEAWNAKLEARMQEMIWSHPKANSYYNNSKRRNFLSWPYRLVDQWNAMRQPELADFEVR